MWSKVDGSCQTPTWAAIGPGEPGLRQRGWSMVAAVPRRAGSTNTEVAGQCTGLTEHLCITKGFRPHQPRQKPSFQNQHQQVHSNQNPVP